MLAADLAGHQPGAVADPVDVPHRLVAGPALAGQLHEAGAVGADRVAEGVHDRDEAVGRRVHELQLPRPGPQPTADALHVGVPVGAVDRGGNGRHHRRPLGRHVDVLAAAGAGALVQGQQRAARRLGAGVEPRLGHRGAHRRPVGVAGERQRARGGQDRQVGRRPVRLGAGAAERRDRDVDEGGVELRQLVGIEPVRTRLHQRRRRPAPAGGTARRRDRGTTLAERFPRAYDHQVSETPSGPSGQAVRAGEPPAGSSATTSAPNDARIDPASCPRWSVRSSTLQPASTGRRLGTRSRVPRRRRGPYPDGVRRVGLLLLLLAPLWAPFVLDRHDRGVPGRAGAGAAGPGRRRRRGRRGDRGRAGGPRGGGRPLDAAPGCATPRVAPELGPPPPRCMPPPPPPVRYLPPPAPDLRPAAGPRPGRGALGPARPAAEHLGLSHRPGGSRRRTRRRPV